MKSTLKIIGLLALLAIAAPSFTFAADKADPAPKAEGKGKGKGGKSQYTSLYAQVDSITATELNVKGGTETKFVINADTKISKDKKGKEPATVADVKVGQYIGGSYTKGADGTNTLHSLHLDVNQDGNKGGKKKAK